MDFSLYSYYRSSASYRVRIGLALKNIPYEYKAVHLLNTGGEQHQDEYRKLNPGREVPTLIHKGRAIGQSMAILQYLDDIQPEPRLFPQDPFKKAQVVQVCEIINSGIQPLVNLRVLQELEKRYQIDTDRRNQWAVYWLIRGFEVLEASLVTTAAKYSFGHEVSAADCFLVPHVFSAYRYDVKPEAFPTVFSVYKNCQALPAFREASPEFQPDTLSTS